ncbi:hypothetical protein [Roseateles terrae]|uniref:HEAT repeat domain-containing protein n=1 Tax=Roseateles terrae TaxID=431060 RepID=A0ABR6GLS7_9BURK|nr:hypothetical protein [Roseateles terrae]MBB3193070.1 hypothetical protein [Roseateles terrae]OWQ89692.1 hypothetical protein CDN98_04025 [Roseateles terrae]
MKKIASATLARPQAPARRSTVDVVELDLPGTTPAPAARFVVTVRHELSESSLTAAPISREEALRKAYDFIQRRLAAGDRLLRQEGFEMLPGTGGDAAVSQPPTGVPPSSLSSLSAGAAAGTAPQPLSTAPSASPTGPVPPSVAALVARFQPDRWKLLPPGQRSRAAWRVAECSAADHPPSAAQQALRQLVPRLVDLLETGDDLLDLCLAAALARLADPGAAEAMKQLASRGRSPATQRYARQAWLMLDAQARTAEAARLQERWGDALALEAFGEGRVAAMVATMSRLSLDWPDLLQDWYDLALVQPEVREPLLDLLDHLPLRQEAFQGIRYVYKAAELRRDAEVIGRLHARFEQARPNPPWPPAPYDLSPAPRETTGRPTRKRPTPPNTFTVATRRYLVARGLRQLRRLAWMQHPFAPTLAVQLLLGMDDGRATPATSEAHYPYENGRYQRVERFYPTGAHWKLLSKVLLPHLPHDGSGPRSLRFWTRQPLDLSQPPAQRPEAFQALWDQSPGALLELAMKSRSAIVQWVAARALQDHVALLQQQPVPVLEALLRSPYPTTVDLGFQAVKARLLASAPPDQVGWLRLLAASSHAPAQDFALLHIAGDPVTFAQFPALTVGLLLSGQPRARKQGQGLALLAPTPALLQELLSALAAVDEDAPELAETGAVLEEMLAGPLGEAAAAHLMPMIGDLLPLLDHPATPVVSLAVTWLLRHPAGPSFLPPTTLTRLLSAEDAGRRACGARLLAALSDEVLRGQAEMMGTLATSDAAAIRAAIGPALLRVAAQDAGFARTVADRLHASLFQTESGDGAHDDALRWLTGPLANAAPARDPSGTWRALQARSSGAQRYGAWALTSRVATDFSLRQWATLARHIDQQVRLAAMKSLDHLLPASPTLQQTDELLPLAEAGFDDARLYAETLIGERLPDESLSLEFLISLVDHPSRWVQALGRSRLVRRMSAADATLCLTRLSQHPGPQVQLFVTQWLLELPTDDPAALAARLRGLTPYFLAVLSQVHRGRTAKSRVIEFLRGRIDAPATAEVVAAIFARQVVTASLTDKPQYIAGLRDIAARHPTIALPFLQWKTPAAASSAATDA